MNTEKLKKEFDEHGYLFLSDFFDGLEMQKLKKRSMILF